MEEASVDHQLDNISKSASRTIFRKWAEEASVDHQLLHILTSARRALIRQGIEGTPADHQLKNKPKSAIGTNIRRLSTHIKISISALGTTVRKWVGVRRIRRPPTRAKIPKSTFRTILLSKWMKAASVHH